MGIAQRQNAQHDIKTCSKTQFEDGFCTRHIPLSPELGTGDSHFLCRRRELDFIIFSPARGITHGHQSEAPGSPKDKLPLQGKNMKKANRLSFTYISL